jgi:hypothetical protein
VLITNAAGFAMHRAPSKGRARWISTFIVTFMSEKIGRHHAFGRSLIVSAMVGVLTIVFI